VLACFPDNALAEMVTQTIRGRDIPAQSPMTFNLPPFLIIRVFRSLTVLDMADRCACPHDWLRMCNALAAARNLQELSLPNLLIITFHAHASEDRGHAVLLLCLESLEGALSACCVKLSTFRLAVHSQPFNSGHCPYCRELIIKKIDNARTSMAGRIASISILHYVTRLLMIPRLSSLREFSLGVEDIVSTIPPESKPTALISLFSALGKLSHLQVLRFQGWGQAMTMSSDLSTREVRACMIHVLKLHKLTELGTDDYPMTNPDQVDKSIFPSEIPFRWIQYV
jgi:hypothetical protein